SGSMLGEVWWRVARSPWVFTWLAAVFTGLSVVSVPFALWSAEQTKPARKLVSDCAPYLRPDSAFATVDLEQSTLVWYFRKHTHDFRKVLQPGEAAGVMAQPGPRFCVMEQEMAANLFP